tara:strand:+ start:225 stop:515 length:291 start_codon:yes stop_codon:yes gene_type:complete
MNNMENPELKKTVGVENDLKNFIVEYCGGKHNPEDMNVTLEMVIETMAKDFPELVLALAEENWVRGYQQGLDDVQAGSTLMEQERESKKSCKLCKK